MKLYTHIPLAEGTSLERVSEYHQRTKHALDAYAAGPTTLDWGDQPEAFRWFEGADIVELPFVADGSKVAYADLFEGGRVPSAPFTLQSVGQLFELALGLAAWKELGPDRWALRCNPSSGNLHPTEGYLLAPSLSGLTPGLYHYLSRDHLLERRCDVSEEAEALGALLGERQLLVGLSSIHWREAWKYGERAFRYCQLDIGHAFGAIAVAAATLGWRAQWLDGAGDAQIARLLGLDRVDDFRAAEGEQPDLLIQLSPLAHTLPAEPDLEALAALLAAARWQGRANGLRAEHYHDWPLVAEVSEATLKPVTPALTPAPPALPPLAALADSPRAAMLIRQRRSAQAFDGASSLSAARFYRLLDTLLPRTDALPWRGVNDQPRLHLLLFIHRVGGLKPGLYLLARSAQGEALLREELRDDFLWQRPSGVPDHLPFFQLLEGDSRQAAATLSCHQPIAANGAFAVAMLAEFEAGLVAGSWGYRRLYWEAGLLGQLLYLEAEAVGLSGTGIGCFFDDTVHELLGIEGNRVQSLYHFTVGGAVRDGRIADHSPWFHLPVERGAG